MARGLAASLPVLLAGRAAAQWVEVDAPTVGPVAALSSPYASQPFFTSLATPNFGPIGPEHGADYIDGAGSAWSTDEGASWLRTHSGRTPLFSDVEHHPNDSAILWGAAHNVWKSVDGGRSFVKVYSSSNAVERLAVDPTNPNRIYGVGQPVVPGGSLHTSTDGGLTWTPSDPFFFNTYADVLVVPSPGAGMGVLVLASQSGILRSIDGGTTFNEVLPNKNARRLAVARQNARVLWCITQLPDEATELWQSLDGGITWSSRASPAPDLNAVAAHPTDAKRAWVVSGDSGPFYTLDGGQTWTPGSGVSPIAALTSLALSPLDPATLLAGGVGGHGGMWRSVDSGLTWKHVDQGLPAPIPDLSFDSFGRLYAVGLGVPVRRDVAAPPWEAMHYPDGGTSRVASLAVHPTDPHTIAWVNQATSLYVQASQLIVTNDDGATWKDATPEGAKHWVWDVQSVVFDAQGTLYAGTNDFLYRSHDLGATWIVSDAPWGEPDDPTQLIADPFDPNRLHALSETAYHSSFDKGRTWPIMHRFTQEKLPFDLVVSPAVLDRLFVLSGSFEKHLYESHNGGVTWTAAPALGLPTSGLTRLAVDPANPSRILVGTTSKGVYLSVDGGATFSSFSTGIEGSTVVALEFEPGSAGKAWLSAADGRLFVRSVP